jgi:hypothetical protein
LLEIKVSDKPDGQLNVIIFQLTYYCLIAILTAVEDTTFLQDAFDEINDADMDNVYGDELITNHRLKKIKPTYVNYAKTAKRVDVRRLKDNIWKTLKTEPVRYISQDLCFVSNPSANI